MIRGDGRTCRRKRFRKDYAYEVYLRIYNGYSRTIEVGGGIGKDIDFPENVEIKRIPDLSPTTVVLNLKILADLRGKITEEDICSYMELVSLDQRN